MRRKPGDKSEMVIINIDKKFIFIIVLVSIISIIITLITYQSSLYIFKTFQKPPTVRGLLWEKLPYFKSMWLTEICLALSFLFMIYHGIKKDIYIIPYYMSLIFMLGYTYFFQKLKNQFLIMITRGIENIFI